jgi:hypothetical protein
VSCSYDRSTTCMYVVPGKLYHDPACQQYLVCRLGGPAAGDWRWLHRLSSSKGVAHICLGDTRGTDAGICCELDTAGQIKMLSDIGRLSMHIE